MGTSKIIAHVNVHALLVTFGILVLPGTEPKAGDQYDCKISGVGVFAGINGWYLQCDGGTRVGAPACATAQNQWAMPWSASGSKEAYALAMVAWLSGANVRLNGNNSCTLLSNRETLNGLERSGM